MGSVAEIFDNGDDPPTSVTAGHFFISWTLIACPSIVLY